VPFFPDRELVPAPDVVVAMGYPSPPSIGRRVLVGVRVTTAKGDPMTIGGGL
jgi:hypothetical protein